MAYSEKTFNDAFEAYVYAEEMTEAGHEVEVKHLDAETVTVVVTE